MSIRTYRERSSHVYVIIGLASIIDGQIGLHSHLCQSGA